MLKLNRTSLIINQPEISDLRECIETLVEKSEQVIKQQLQKQQQKLAKVQAIEKEFVEWAQKKQNQIRQKLQRSNKNKEDHLKKIVKKCKDHEKYLEQKRKAFYSRKRASLREAWKKSEEYKHDSEDSRPSKYAQKQKQTLNKDAQQTKSQYVHEKQFSLYQIQQNKQYIGANLNVSKLYGNPSKEYLAELNQSIKQFKNWAFPKTIVKLDTVNQTIHQSIEKSKFQATLSRFKQNKEMEQKSKIQQLGERFQKIQKTRFKKLQSLKKKHNEHQHSLQDSHVQKRERKKVDKSQRVHSQSMVQQKRTKDWSENNRQKRQQFMQMHIQTGNEYLQSQKIKFLKTNLAKRIALSAIQKKLFIERLNH